MSLHLLHLLQALPQGDTVWNQTIAVSVQEIQACIRMLEESRRAPALAFAGATARNLQALQIYSQENLEEPIQAAKDLESTLRRTLGSPHFQDLLPCIHTHDKWWEASIRDLSRLEPKQAHRFAKMLKESVHLQEYTEDNFLPYCIELIFQLTDFDAKGV